MQTMSSWPPLPPTRTREIGPPHPDRQIWDRGHSFVASRSEKVGPPQNWEVPQNHDFEVIEPVNLGQLLILKCPRFLEMVIPKWLTRQICRLTRKFHYAYRFVDKNRTNTRFASVRASARSTRRAEANRVFVLDLTTKRYVCKRLASLHKFVASLCGEATLILELCEKTHI